MRTPITYYGGKQMMARTILGMIPSHKVYCEPYFGGGAVFFEKGKSYLEVINDINDRLITFYEVCQSDKLFPLLMDKVTYTLHSERAYQQARRIWNNPGQCDNQVDIAWAVWLVTNLSYAATPRGGWKWDNGTAGSHTGIVMDNYRKEFTAALHDRLRTVQISCRDALTVIRQRDSHDTFFFLDPPYPGCEQKHYKGFKEEDLEELLQLLTTLKGRFLLCNYDSPLLRKYEKEYCWSRKVLDLPLNITHFKGGTRRKQEVMFFNYVTEPSLFAAD